VPAAGTPILPRWRDLAPNHTDRPQFPPKLLDVSFDLKRSALPVWQNHRNFSLDSQSTKTATPASQRYSVIESRSFYASVEDVPNKKTVHASSITSKATADGTIGRGVDASREGGATAEAARKKRQAGADGTPTALDSTARRQSAKESTGTPSEDAGRRQSAGTTRRQSDNARAPLLIQTSGR
jgi:hypothetical protein